MYKTIATVILILIQVSVAVCVAAADGLTQYKELTISSGKKTPYAVHIPDGYDPRKSYPVLIGPGDGTKEGDTGYYWQTDAHGHGWIIIDARLWERNTSKNLNTLLDAVAADFKVEGGKFHAACWSANSGGIFRLVTDNTTRFHSVTGMAGNPSRLSDADIDALRNVKVQFVVGEKDRSWQRSARAAHEKLKAGGVDSVMEIIPNGGHVMDELVGKGFLNRLEKLR